MKNVIVLLLVALFAVGVTASKTEAQVKSISMRYETSGDDTATNADTLYLLGTVNGAYDLQFKVTATKVSGTVAGDIVLQGSVDNSTWFNLTSTTTGVVTGYTEDTATLTNGTASYWWNIPAHKYNYYKVVYRTSGTQVSVPTATIYYRKND